MLVTDAFRAWGGFGASMRHQIALQPKEARILAYGLIACVVGFLASVPDALEQASGLTEEDAIPAVLIGRLFGALFFAPLFFYAVAAISGWIARLAGLDVSYYHMRLALFWSLLVATPVLVVVRLAGLFAEGAHGDFRMAVYIIGFAVFCIVWGCMISAASSQKQR
ncbi:hypothetical protein [Halovulum sp. GXIMD14793]